MPDSCLIHAPAKINLHLRIGAPRDDGFHDVLSLIHSVSLCDTITVELDRRARPSIGVVGNPAVSERRDLCFRAAELFLDAAHLAARVEIRIVKRIPIGAGLGGGSSDAAAVLKALDALVPGRVESNRLAALGARLGSDVPFFLGGAASVVTGRGETVRACAHLRGHCAVIADPGDSISTAEAFAWLDADRAARGVVPADFHLSNGVDDDPWNWEFTNDFTPIIARHRPKIAALLGAFASGGAKYAGLSGSGGCVYAVFSSKTAALSACERVECPSRWVVYLLESTFSPVLQ